MILLHTTLVDRVSPILDAGICVRYSQGTLRRVWLHRRTMRAWAREHVCKRHNTTLEHVVTLEVVVPDSWIHQHTPGLYFVERDIPPAHVLSVQFHPHQWGGKLS